MNAGNIVTYGYNWHVSDCVSKKHPLKSELLTIVIIMMFYENVSNVKYVLREKVLTINYDIKAT